MYNSERRTIDDHDGSFYLHDSEGYQSWEILSKHPCDIEIAGRDYKIVYKENRMVTDKKLKRIDDENYYGLISVFKKYKSILSEDFTPALKSFPFGGCIRIYINSKASQIFPTLRSCSNQTIWN